MCCTDISKYNVQAIYIIQADSQTDKSLNTTQTCPYTHMSIYTCVLKHAHGHISLRYQTQTCPYTDMSKSIHRHAQTLITEYLFLFFLDDFVGPLYGQRMGLRVKHPFIQRNKRVVGERQVQILEGLGQEEALLDVVLGWTGLVHVPYTCVPPVHSTVLLQSLQCNGKTLSSRFCFI